MYSPSCIRFAGIVLPAEAPKVFMFLWKKCMYSSSCGRAASIILPFKELQIFCFFEKAGGILHPIGKLKVFFFL